MSYILEKVSVDSFYGNMLLGLFKILHKNPRIHDVYLDRYRACSMLDILNWEQMHGIKLPQDLKHFYLSSDGFKLTWSYKFSSEATRVGNLSVCPLKEFILMTGYKVEEESGIHIVDQNYRLHLDDKSKVFQLAHVDDESKVCLIYPNPECIPTIWLADDDLNWHFLAHKFKEYFKMAISHLGIPYWQYCFTPQGPPPWAEQIIILEASHLLNYKSYNIAQKNNVSERKTRKIDVNVINKDVLKTKEPRSLCFYQNRILRQRRLHSR